MAIGPVVRVIDALAVHKDEDGTIEVQHLPAGSAAALILPEHHWAVGLRDAVLRTGGFRLSEGFISPHDLVDIGLLTSEEAMELHAAEGSHQPA